MRVAFIMSLVAGILSTSGLNATTCCKPSHGLPAAIDRQLLLSARMMHAMQLFESFAGDVGVNLGGGNVGVAEQ